MSVRTTADEKIDEAKEHVQEALECLLEVVVNNPWGTSEYSQDYLQKLRRQLNTLLDVRDDF